MTMRKRWLTSLSLWLAAPMVAFIVAVNLEDGLQFATRGYWLTATTVASEAVSITGVVAALGATWEASRLRRARLLAVTARHRLLVVGESLLPTVVVVLTGTLVSYAMMATIALGAPGGPAWHVIGVNLAALAGIIGWGLFLGFALPATLALAVSLASTYVWYFSTAAVGGFPLWARYLSGGFLSDPGVWGATDPRALFGALACAVGLGTAGLCTVLSRDRGRALVAGPLAVVVAVGLGCLIVRPLDHHPVVPRAGIACDDTPVDGVTVCLWPELEADREELTAEIVRQHQAFSAMGVDPPPIVSAAQEEPEASMWIPLVPQADPRSVVAAGFVEALMPAALPESCDTFPDDTVVAVLAWLRTVARAHGHEEYRASIPAEPARYLDQVLELPPRAQGEWYLANRPVMETCSPDPDTLDPRHFGAEAAR